MQRLGEPVDTSRAMTKSTPASTAQPTCSSNIARTAAARLGVVGLVDVGVADVARDERAALVRDLLRDRAAPARLSGSSMSSLPIDPQLLAMAVVRERLDDVGAGAHELAVELRARPPGWSSTTSGT